METEVTVAEDEWRTLKRILPRDVFEIIRDTEINVIGAELGTRGEALGSSVAIWTIITRLIDEHREELRAMAKEWKPDAEA